MRTGFAERRPGARSEASSDSRRRTTAKHPLAAACGACFVLLLGASLSMAGDEVAIVHLSTELAESPREPLPLPPEIAPTWAQAWLSTGPDAPDRVFVPVVASTDADDATTPGQRFAVAPPSSGWSQHHTSTVMVLTAPHARHAPDGVIVLRRAFSPPSALPPDLAGREDVIAAWEFDFTRWGLYDAELTYALTGHDAQPVHFASGDRDAAAVTLPGTGDPTRFETRSLGRHYIANSGRQRLVLRAGETGDPGAGPRPPDAWRIRALVLRPAPEGGPIRQGGDGTILLHARDAIVHGVMLRYEPAPQKNCLGFWTNPDDEAEWRFEVSRPGTFRVELSQGCGEGQGGSAAEIVTGSVRLPFIVEDTGHFQNFIPRDIGHVTIDGTGGHSLRIRATRKRHAAVMDVREIRLVPAAPEASPDDSPE